jgi:hypothetical protein
MARIRLIRIRPPQWVRCPRCHQRQPFRKKTAHWKLVKDLDSQQPRVLKVQVVYAKCRNPDCLVQRFALPTPGIGRYQRATTRLQAEAIAGLIDDNSTLQKTSGRLNRSLNTTASKSAIDRWKHRAASQVSCREILKALGFSGVLAIDGFKPTRSKTFDLIACDARRDRILYVETLPRWAAWKTGTVSHGDLEAFLRRLEALGIHPWVIVFDPAIGPLTCQDVPMACQGDSWRDFERRGHGASKTPIIPLLVWGCRSSPPNPLVHTWV